ncbi:hypothetical protein M427DRAFT_34121 [Gonapodya prolifera JEL478]|uniref:Uncharacterized protein n=1 Tax=Gonapodya prolifera (strain JEL478) TaxID=1344416 RepID=A0A139A919_GONPJ|nr:hypothetical protein M427DRAFT_34121 [Gonapodya prolifera JEL478]|eukprot:KXS13256.1 hypothetical protein M427DRAFT_34121 [Gonapodya prolifera JEL478]
MSFDLAPCNVSSFLPSFKTVSGYTDRAKAAITPDSHKSTGQQIHDRARGASDEAHRDDRTLMEKAKDALGVDRHDHPKH